MLTLLPFRTLRGRLSLLVCLATLPAFIFVVYVASEERAVALGRAEDESLRVADLASREHAVQIAGARRLLERLADSSDAAALQALLPPILAGFPQFANLGLLDPDGRIVYSVVPPPQQVNMLTIPAIPRALQSQEVEVGTYLIGLIVGRPILIMAKSLRRETGQAPRVLFAALDLEWLDRLTKQAGLPPQSALLIVDSEGTILASSLAAARGKNGSQHLAGFRQLMQRPKGLTRCETPDGIARLAVATPLQGVSDVWVVVGPPEASVQALANRVFYRDLVVLALLALFAVISSLIATDVAVLRDIRQLATATRRFGKGELSTRAPVPRPHGELRDLTVAFNSMAETLELRDRQAVQAQQHLRALSHRLQTVREEEAARIAQELHDELGQELSVLRLELDRLRRKLGNRTGCAEDWIAQIDALGEQVDIAVRSVRRIASELRPGVLDRLGLAAGLEWLLGEFERRTGIHAVLESDGVEPDIDPETATAVFRITQEALTNVARHAGASLVETRLSGSENGLHLSVRDDGRGFDPEREPQAPSLGLLGMKERATRLGGSFRVVSATGRGTELRVTIPRRVLDLIEEAN